MNRKMLKIVQTHFVLTHFIYCFQKKKSLKTVIVVGRKDLRLRVKADLMYEASN